MSDAIIKKLLLGQDSLFIQNACFMSISIPVGDNWCAILGFMQGITNKQQIPTSLHVLLELKFFGFLAFDFITNISLFLLL